MNFQVILIIKTIVIIEFYEQLKPCTQYKYFLEILKKKLLSKLEKILWVIPMYSDALVTSSKYV